MVDCDCYVSDEEDESGLGEAGLSTGVTESGTKEAEEVQWTVQSASILSYMLKPPSFLTQGFRDNNKAQENILKHMCDFGAWEDWRSGKRSISSYIGVETRKY